jgi:phosphinothricin acetyltransferase
MNEPIIRTASPSDSGDIVRIYAPYVTNTAITFDEEVPTVAMMSGKIRDTLAKHPFLVAELGERVVGYAYASEFRPRASFRWSVETTVYVSRDSQRQGVGRALYNVLLSTLTRQGFVTAYGVITLPGVASVALHESFGFARIAVFHAVGFKLGAWHDVGFWERRLNTATNRPTEPGVLL